MNRIRAKLEQLNNCIMGMMGLIGALTLVYGLDLIRFDRIGVDRIGSDWKGFV